MNDDPITVLRPLSFVNSSHFGLPGPRGVQYAKRRIRHTPIQLNNLRRRRTPENRVRTMGRSGEPDIDKCEPAVQAAGFFVPVGPDDSGTRDGFERCPGPAIFRALAKSTNQSISK